MTGLLTRPWRHPRWARGREAEQAWAAWTRGDIPEIDALAGHIPSPAREHLLFLSAYARGRYASALTHYAAVGEAGHPGASRLDQPVAEALLHLGRPQEAVEHLARSRGRRAVPAGMSLRAANPLEVRLGQTTVIPFADDELAPYMPGFEITIDGVAVRARLDTGGTFLLMGTERAAALGIPLVKGGRSNHGLNVTTLHHGLAAEVRIGGAVLANVPVQALPTLRGEQDIVIIGTNVLQRFLATVDNPGRCLVLAPRGAGEARPEGTEIPFYLWGDHYMFARGGYGERRDLNFFVDSGLVYVADDDGRPRQACLWATAERYRSWGVPAPLAAGPHFPGPEPVSLGPLRQDDHLLATVPARRTPWQSLGGVRIDGMLTHAFLARYRWTLDFDRHVYRFATGTPRP